MDTKRMVFAVGLVALVAGTGVPARSEPTTAVSGAGTGSKPVAIDVAVDTRVELVAIVFRFAGSFEYAMSNSESPYSHAVDDWFEEYREHPAVKEARRLREARGISFNAPMDLAVHLTDLPGLRERFPLETAPRLDSRWKPEEARAFVALLRKFAADSHAAEFFRGERGFFDQAAARMRAALAARVDAGWLERFFGVRPRVRFVAIPGLLNGGANYGCGVVFPDGREEILPIIGVSKWDAKGLPLFGDDFVPTVVHEFVHSYTNPLVDAWAERLRAPFERMFEFCSPTMGLQAYGSWKDVAYESLVRAAVVRYLAATDGKSAARKQLEQDEERNGFAWTGGLAELLGRYEAARERTPDLAAFMPEIAAFFDGYSIEYARRMAAAPHVSSLSPADGATDVDPTTATLELVFDRPMAPGSWAFVGGGPSFPELVGDPSFDESGKVLRVGVRLEPGRSYRLMLNSLDHHGFRSRDGLLLQPVEWSFATRGP